MGLTFVKVTVSIISKKKKAQAVKFLVDSGVVYSVLPETIWKTLSLKPLRTLEFTLADGTVVTRDVSECRFEIDGLAGVSPVILGIQDDLALLGTVTLEVLGLIIDPFSRKLHPMKLMIA